MHLATVAIQLEPGGTEWATPLPPSHDVGATKQWVKDLPYGDQLAYVYTQHGIVLKQRVNWSPAPPKRGRGRPKKDE